VHDHRLDAELAAGALDAQRHFATVGDEDFFKHGKAAMGYASWVMRKTSKPVRRA
jgi:hypothetical protein